MILRFSTAIVILCASSGDGTDFHCQAVYLASPIVLIMFGAMLGYTLGIWEFTESVRATRESTRSDDPDDAVSDVAQIQLHGTEKTWR